MPLCFFFLPLVSPGGKDEDIKIFLGLDILESTTSQTEIVWTHKEGKR